MNWPEFPSLRISICFIVGVAVGGFLKLNLEVLLGLVTLCIGYSAYHSNRHGLSDRRIVFLSLLLLLAGFLCGVMRAQLQGTGIDNYHYSRFTTDDKDELIGVILEDVKQKTSIKTTLGVKSLNGQSCRGRLLIYFPKEDSVSHLSPGDVIALKSKVVATRENSNPYAFDYKAYLANRGIHYQAYMRKGEYQLVEKGNLGLVQDVAYRLRAKALHTLEVRLATEDQLATASAMILGFRDHISEELYNAYATTGSVHVLAVSGLHVGIVCGLFFYLFKFIKSEMWYVRIVKATFLISLVWFYAVLTGAAPAVIRAALMFTIVIFGQYWFGRQNIYNTLAISAVMLLMYDPLLLYQASFQFSYLALTSIVFWHKVWYPKVQSRFTVVDYVWNLGVVAAAAQVLVFPVTVYYFHKFPLYFIISGIISVFLAFFILTIGLMLIFFTDVPLLGDAIAFVFRGLLEVFIGIIYYIRDLPHSNLGGLWLSLSSTVWIYVGLLILMFWVHSKNHAATMYMLSIVVLALIFNNTHYQVRTAHQSAMIVYEVSGGTVMDIFDGTTCYTYKAGDIDKSKEFFAADNYRISNNILNVQPLEAYNKGGLTNGVLQYKDKLVYIPALAADIEKLPMETDITLLTGGVTLWPDKVMGYHCTGQIVVDKSIRWRLKEEWVKYAAANDIPLHDIRVGGAWQPD